MFSRSSRTTRRVARKPATVTIVKPDEKRKPMIDLSKAQISIIKPKAGLRVMVEEENEGED